MAGVIGTINQKQRNRNTVLNSLVHLENLKD